MVNQVDKEVISQHIGKYEILFELRRGGMGSVCLACARGRIGEVVPFERLVAIKRMVAQESGDPGAERRFLEECRLASQVHHANVVAIHQIGSDANGYFLVLDYVEGDSLQGLIQRMAAQGERIPHAILMRIVLDALAGLQAVHEATDAAGRALHMLHRDVSGSNILVGRDGVARLADFGIARASSSPPSTGICLRGKVPYMSPEYLRRDPVGRQLDVYAMGVTLWTALAGHEPWPALADGQILLETVTNGMPRLSSHGITIPSALDDIVTKACHQAPDQRYATALEMSDALEAVGCELGLLATHSQVGEFVNRCAGADFAARRIEASRRIASLGAAKRCGPEVRGSESPTKPYPIRNKRRPSASFGFTAIALFLLGTAYVCGERNGSANSAPLHPEEITPQHQVDSTLHRAQELIDSPAMSSAVPLTEIRGVPEEPKRRPSRGSPTRQARTDP
jgi:serine/threonine-protein kinase